VTAKLYKAEALAVIGAADLIITEEIDSLFDSGELIVEQLHGPDGGLNSRTRTTPLSASSKRS